MVSPALSCKQCQRERRECNGVSKGVHSVASWKEIKSMTQAGEDQFSEEDHRLLMAHRLGKPLHIYQMRPGYILLSRVSSLSMFVLCIVFIVLLISGIALYVKLLSIFYILVWFGSLALLLMIGYYLFLGLRHEEQSRRLIVGEDGLLEIRKMIRRNQMEVVHWKEIRALKKAFIIPEYLIKRRRGEPFVLTPYVFQDGEQLLSLIREHEAEWGSEK